MADTTVNELNFFGYSNGWAKLAECAKKHDPVTFNQVGFSIDTLPVETMRGLAYLGWILSEYPEDERSPMQHAIAHRVLGEMTALVAAMLDHQNEAQGNRMLADCRQAA